MRKNLWYRIIVLVLAGLLNLEVFGQQHFKYAVALGNVDKPGFYKIQLAPDVVAILQPQLHDLRIVDKAGKQIPYIFEDEINNRERDSIWNLPILATGIGKDSQTHIEVGNTLEAPLDNFLLSVRNTDATRTISISGSDNTQNWYIVKENLVLTDLSTSEKDIFTKSLSFPLSDYKFFRITLHGEKLLPLNVVGVGVPVAAASPRKTVIRLADPTIVQRDSINGSTYVDLHFNAMHRINKLSLHLQGNKFFRRNLFVTDRSYSENQHRFILSSGTDLTYEVNFKTNYLQLRIENEDNPPLKLVSVEAYQVQRTLIAWFETGTGYRMIFGDSLAGSPSYDLGYFKDSVTAEVVLLSQGTIEQIQEPSLSNRKNLADGKVWLWITLACILSVLLFFSVRMTNAISKK